MRRSATIVALALAALCCTAPGDDALRPPAEALAELPRPRLESMAPEVARDLAEAQKRFEAEFQDEGLAAGRRARAIGELGRRYHALHLWSAAEACYRNARQLAPEQVDWAYLLAVVLEMQGELEEAATVLAQSGDDSIPALTRLARLELELGETAEAADLFRRILERRETEAAAHAGLGRALLATGESDAARQHLERALELQPGANSLYFFLAQAERALGHQEVAARHLEQQGRVEVGFSDPRVEGLLELAAGSGVDARRGDAALLAGDAAAAVEAYRRAAEKAPDDATIHHSLAAALAATGDYEASQLEYRRGLELDPQNPNLLIGLATAQFELGRTDASLRTLDAALKRDPESIELRVELATFAERAGRPETALAAWQEVLDRDDANVGAMLGRARALAALGRAQEAGRDLEAIVAADPDQLEARFRLAGLLASAGRYAEAATHYRRLVEASPESLQPRLLEATSLVLASRYQEARVRLEAGMKELPEETELAHSLARLLATCPDDAVRDGARALDLAQAAFDAETSLERAETVAMALAELGRFEEATSWQERVLEQAEALGAREALARLSANLERYRRGETARPPWKEGA